MICVAVLEPDVERRILIREWLISYTLRQDCDLEFIKFTDRNPITKVGNYAKRIQIGLISLDNPLGEEIGRALYEQNPDCRICYYREQPCPLEGLLPTRPIGFYLMQGGREGFLQKFHEIYEEVRMSRLIFRFETKSRMYLIPRRSILYFRSDLRYVNVCLLSGDNPRILAKLSEVEPVAGDGFMRIHKSYLVNIKHVLWMDKKSHTVLLSNGEQLPVSDAQYERVCEMLRQEA